MNSNDFTIAAISIVGTDSGWQTKIAELIGCDSRRVRQWLADNETPAWVDKWLASMNVKFPADEWIFGETDDADYIIHGRSPRFIGRIAPTITAQEAYHRTHTSDQHVTGWDVPDFDAPKSKDISYDPQTYQMVGEGLWIGDIVWIDAPPQSESATNLLLRKTLDEWKTFRENKKD